MPVLTIREQSIRTLHDAEKAGRITHVERCKVCALWEENDEYMRHPLVQVRPDYLAREAEAAEIARRAGV